MSNFTKIVLMILAFPFGFLVTKLCFSLIDELGTVMILVAILIIVAVPTLIVRPWKKSAPVKGK